ncbi:HAD hydrolase family IIID [Cryptococcus deuterogattii R265]|uniref:HAD hydrolase family IIID n=1 Tax=Cryptococcus deuterogattii (strain R265) TaxID=294750 RepID=UPI001938E596|nr:HAD hydrolase family IIID [Cryptococcus deuterogattii R265]
MSPDDEPPRRSLSCNEPHFQSDAAVAAGNDHLSATQPHKALGNHSMVDGEETTSVEGQQEQSNENDEGSITTTSSPVQQVDHQGEGEGGGDDLVDSDDVNMEDDGSLEVSAVPLAEEVDEEWWDLKMQWGGKVYDIRVGGNDMVYDFRERIASLTSVPPDAQKLIGLSSAVKGKLNASHDAMRFAHLGVKNGGKFVLVGTKVEERFIDPIKALREGEGAGEDEFDVDYKGKGPGNDPRNKRKIQEIIDKVPITVMNAPREGKKLLVLDLDYTIVDTKPLLNGALPSSECARPGLHDFLKLVYPHYDIVIWSQTSWRWLETKLVELDLISDSREYKISFVIDRSCMFPVFSQRNGQLYKHEVKPLAYLWASFPQWSAKNTIHVDDLSRNFALNPGEGLKIRAFNKAGSPDGQRDRELIKLGTYLLGIAASEKDFTTVNHKYWSGRGRRGRH